MSVKTSAILCAVISIMGAFLGLYFLSAVGTVFTGFFSYLAGTLEPKDPKK